MKGLEKKGLVWVGFENGCLVVWKEGIGGLVGEELAFSSALVKVRPKRFSLWRILPNLNNNLPWLTLSHGELRWGENETLSMKQMRRVNKRKDEKTGGFLFSLWGEGTEDQLTPEFEVDSEEVLNKWVDVLEFYVFCEANKEKTVIYSVGELNLGGVNMGGVLSLSVINGRVWSIEGSLRITEWETKPDETGIQKGKYLLSHLRSLVLTNHHPDLLSKFYGSCLVSAGEKEIWVIFGKTVYVLNRTSILEEAQKEGGKEEGTLEMGRDWDLFGEGEQKEGKREREEVWCGVYCRFTKALWVGTAEGYVCRKRKREGQLQRREVGGGGVRTIEIIGNQVWCGTMSGSIHRFDLLSFTPLENNNSNNSPHDFAITSIAVQHGVDNWKV
eukprot:CAMPEP_0201543030 /NCGR_PEP_ID=MMETSP0161_2-20130828/72358_1 /ASSEMBLY_ACC=CAM_ASM_000251 /TAXON_ID=180227 /ORGANISM="Neoparamoeba aestuarina, Strain SoJaBio B1-5/56/2" /LENGTH=385 /DNA_ID=CAMNT_0047950737 /DNA_START=520 /DNA_END=1673 /DNA_ORIENTATION=+